MARGYWLVKSEPGHYAWTDLVQDGGTCWDGVRNHAARNHLATMKKRDLVLYYHSQIGKAVVGIARVTHSAYPDPTIRDERWVAVDLEPVRALARPVGLAEIRADRILRSLPLVRQSRLSVMPVERRQYDRVVELAKRAAPA